MDDIVGVACSFLTGQETTVLLDDPWAILLRSGSAVSQVGSGIRPQRFGLGHFGVLL